MSTQWALVSISHPRNASNGSCSESLRLLCWGGRGQRTRELRENNSQGTLTRARVQQPTGTRARQRGGRGWGRRERGWRGLLRPHGHRPREPRVGPRPEALLVLLPSLAQGGRRAVCAYAEDPCTWCFCQAWGTGYGGEPWGQDMEGDLGDRIRRGSGPTAVAQRVPPEFPLTTSHFTLALYVLLGS